MWVPTYGKSAADVEVGPRPLYPMMLESPELRWAFIRKIYTILSIQLLLTIAVACLVVTVRPISHFFVTSPEGLGLYILVIILPFIGKWYMHALFLVFVCVFLLLLLLLFWGGFCELFCFVFQMMVQCCVLCITILSGIRSIWFYYVVLRFVWALLLDWRALSPVVRMEFFFLYCALEWVVEERSPVLISVNHLWVEWVIAKLYIDETLIWVFEFCWCYEPWMLLVSWLNLGVFVFLLELTI